MTRTAGHDLEDEEEVVASSIDWPALDAIELIGLNGTRVIASSLWAERKVVLVMLRPFSCVTCLEIIGGLGRLQTLLRDRGFTLVFISPNDVPTVTAFVESLRGWFRDALFRRDGTFPGELYSDPTLRSHGALGLRRGFFRSVLKVMFARDEERQGYTRFEVIQLGRRLRRLLVRDPRVRHDPHFNRGHYSLLGGTFVLGAGHAVLHAGHRDRFQLDLISPDAVARVCAVRPEYGTNMRTLPRAASTQSNLAKVFPGVQGAPSEKPAEPPLSTDGFLTGLTD